MKDYTGWQQRIVDEKDELQEKLTKLQDFLKTENYENLDDFDKNLLIGQANAMASYIMYLILRISRFSISEPSAKGEVYEEQPDRKEEN